MPTTSQALKTAQFGIIGLGVMGGNLALNLDDHHHSVAVWNLESEWVDRFVGNNRDRHFVAPKSLPEFCHSLERPRRILMMITAGDPVDQTLQKIIPYLTPGDIVMEIGRAHV